jgi:hypothetical protein
MSIAQEIATQLEGWVKNIYANESCSQHDRGPPLPEILRTCQRIEKHLEILDLEQIAANVRSGRVNQIPVVYPTLGNKSEQKTEELALLIWAFRAFILIRKNLNSTQPVLVKR